MGDELKIFWALLRVASAEQNRIEGKRSPADDECYDSCQKHAGQACLVGHPLSVLAQKVLFVHSVFPFLYDGAYGDLFEPLRWFLASSSFTVARFSFACCVTARWIVLQRIWRDGRLLRSLVRVLFEIFFRGR